MNDGINFYKKGAIKIKIKGWEMNKIFFYLRKVIKDFTNPLK